MPEWWSYSLSDFLLFSPRTYYRLFELYNAAVCPAHIVALAGGVVAAFLLRNGPANARIVAGILVAGWLFVACAYHWQRYATINLAAPYYAAGFAIEAMLLLWIGVIRSRLHFRPNADITSRMGFGLFLFALLIQPLIGLLFDRPWIAAEIFVIAPDPTAVATAGILATASRTSWLLLVIPLAWCAISGATLWAMEAPDALVTPLGGLFALALAALRPLSSKD